MGFNSGFKGLMLYVNVGIMLEVLEEMKLKMGS